MRQGLDGLAGFARDDEQRLRDIDVAIERPDRFGDGSIEHVKLRIAGRARKCRCEQLGALRRTAHPEDYDVAEARISHFVGERCELIHPLEHRFNNRQPAERVPDSRLLRRFLRPQRGVLLP